MTATRHFENLAREKTAGLQTFRRTSRERSKPPAAARATVPATCAIDRTSANALESSPARASEPKTSRAARDAPPFEREVGDVTLTLAKKGHKAFSGKSKDGEAQASENDACRIDVALPLSDVNADLTGSVNYDLNTQDANLSLGYNSVGFYQMTKLAIIPCTVAIQQTFYQKQARSIHWFPYDRAGEVDADP